MSHAAAPPPDHTDLDVERGAFARWWWIPAGLVVVALFAWWMTHPTALPTGGTVSAPTRVDQTMYVGMRSVEGRVLNIRSVEVDWKGTPKQASWDVYICRGGQLGTSTDPDAWCRDVVPAEGKKLDMSTDQLVIAVAASAPQKLVVEDVRVAYREGIQWGTQSIGPGIEVTVAE